MSRHEKKVAAQLDRHGISYFLPMTSEKHSWSDREKLILAPLFPGYIFVQIALTPQNQLAVLRSAGVVSFVSQCGAPATIPSEQIESVRALLAGKKQFAPHPYLSAGQKVRIRGGSMNGVEGVLLASNRGRSLVVSIEAIGKSIAIEVHGYELEIV